jgi:hypothetical protein
MEVTIGKHKYSCEQITVRDEMKAISLYRSWVIKQGTDASVTDELQNYCRNIAIQSFMIKKIDGKTADSPEAVFKHIMDLPAKDRVSLFVVNGKLNEGTDFLSLMEQLRSTGDEGDKSSSASDLQDSP